MCSHMDLNCTESFLQNLSISIVTTGLSEELNYLKKETRKTHQICMIYIWECYLSSKIYCQSLQD